MKIFLTFYVKIKNLYRIGYEKKGTKDCHAFLLKVMANLIILAFSNCENTTILFDKLDKLYIVRNTITFCTICMKINSPRAKKKKKKPF